MVICNAGDSACPSTQWARTLEWEVGDVDLSCLSQCWFAYPLRHVHLTVLGVIHGTRANVFDCWPLLPGSLTSEPKSCAGLNSILSGNMMVAVPRLSYLVFPSRVGGSLCRNLVLLQLFVDLASSLQEASIVPCTYQILRAALACLCAESLQSCPPLCDPVDHSPPASSVHGILQARILEWVATPSPRGSSRPIDWTHVS